MSISQHRRISSRLVAGVALGALLVGATTLGGGGSASAAVGRTVEFTEIDTLQSSTVRSMSDVVTDAAAQRIYFIDYDANEVVIYDTSNDTLTRIGAVSVGTDPTDLALNAVTRELLVTDRAAEDLTVIDVDLTSPTADTVIDTIPILGVDPLSVAVDDVANVAYVANYASNDVSVVDLSGRTVTRTTISNGPIDIAVDSASHTAYAICEDGGLYAIVGGVRWNWFVLPVTPVKVTVAGGKVLVATEFPAGTPTDFRVRSYDGPNFFPIAESPLFDSRATSVTADAELGLVYVATAIGNMVALSLDDLSPEGTPPLVVSTIDSVTVEPSTHRVFTGESRLAGATVSMYDQLVSPMLVTTTLPAAQVGVPYSAFIETIASPAPDDYSTGALPAGLQLDALTGEISGTPTVSGTFSIPVTVSNTAAMEATGFLTLAIAAGVSPTPTPTPTPTPVPPAPGPTPGGGQGSSPAGYGLHGSGPGTGAGAGTGRLASTGSEPGGAIGWAAIALALGATVITATRFALRRR